MVSSGDKKSAITIFNGGSLEQESQNLVLSCDASKIAFGVFFLRN